MTDIARVVSMVAASENLGFASPGRRGTTLHATAGLLRQRTAETHRRVEAGLDLLDPRLSVARLTAILERLHGFWAGTEAAVPGWLGGDPHLAAALDLPRRRRAPLLRADLERLGVAPDDLPVAAPVFAAGSPAAALGWLYVTEGSTLGGAIIDRRLRTLDGARVPLRSFTPYREGPGPMWRAYLTALESWTAGEAGRADAVAAAAVRTFAALDAWLEPVRVQAAA